MVVEGVKVVVVNIDRVVWSTFVAGEETFSVVVGVTVVVLNVVVRFDKVVYVVDDWAAMVVIGVIVVIVDVNGVDCLKFEAGFVVFKFVVGANWVVLKVVVRFDNVVYLLVD